MSNIDVPGLVFEVRTAFSNTPMDPTMMANFTTKDPVILTLSLARGQLQYTVRTDKDRMARANPVLTIKFDEIVSAKAAIDAPDAFLLQFRGSGVKRAAMFSMEHILIGGGGECCLDRNALITIINCASHGAAYAAHFAATHYQYPERRVVTESTVKKRGCGLGKSERHLLLTPYAILVKARAIDRYPLSVLPLASVAVAPVGSSDILIRIPGRAPKGFTLPGAAALDMPDHEVQFSFSANASRDIWMSSSTSDTQRLLMFVPNPSANSSPRAQRGIPTVDQIIKTVDSASTEQPAMPPSDVLPEQRPKARTLSVMPMSPTRSVLTPTSPLSMSVAPPSRLKMHHSVLGTSGHPSAMNSSGQGGAPRMDPNEAAERDMQRRMRAAAEAEVSTKRPARGAPDLSVSVDPEEAGPRVTYGLPRSSIPTPTANPMSPGTVGRTSVSGAAGPSAPTQPGGRQSGSLGRGSLLGTRTARHSVLLNPAEGRLQRLPPGMDMPEPVIEPPEGSGSDDDEDNSAQSPNEGMAHHRPHRATAPGVGSALHSMFNNPAGGSAADLPPRAPAHNKMQPNVDPAAAPSAVPRRSIFGNNQPQTAAQLQAQELALIQPVDDDDVPPPPPPGVAPTGHLLVSPTSSGQASPPVSPPGRSPVQIVPTQSPFMLQRGASNGGGNGGFNPAPAPQVALPHAGGGNVSAGPAVGSSAQRSSSATRPHPLHMSPGSPAMSTATAPSPIMSPVAAANPAPVSNLRPGDISFVLPPYCILRPVQKRMRRRSTAMQQRFAPTDEAPLMPFTTYPACTAPQPQVCEFVAVRPDGFRGKPPRALVFDTRSNAVMGELCLDLPLPLKDPLGRSLHLIMPNDDANMPEGFMVASNGLIFAAADDSEESPLEAVGAVPGSEDSLKLFYPDFDPDAIPPPPEDDGFVPPPPQEPAGLGGAFASRVANMDLPPPPEEDPYEERKAPAAAAPMHGNRVPAAQTHSFAPAPSPRLAPMPAPSPKAAPAPAAPRGLQPTPAPKPGPAPVFYRAPANAAPPTPSANAFGPAATPRASPFAPAATPRAAGPGPGMASPGMGSPGPSSLPPCPPGLSSAGPRRPAPMRAPPSRPAPRAPGAAPTPTAAGARPTMPVPAPGPSPTIVSSSAPSAGMGLSGQGSGRRSPSPAPVSPTPRAWKGLAVDTSDDATSASSNFSPATTRRAFGASAFSPRSSASSSSIAELPTLVTVLVEGTSEPLGLIDLASLASQPRDPVGGATFAPSVHGTLPLAALRQAVEDELDDVPAAWFFLLRGVKVGRKQEERVTVLDLAEGAVEIYRRKTNVPVTNADAVHTAIGYEGDTSLLVTLRDAGNMGTLARPIPASSSGDLSMSNPDLSQAPAGSHACIGVGAPSPPPGLLDSSVEASASAASRSAKLSPAHGSPLSGGRGGFPAVALHSVPADSRRALKPVRERKATVTASGSIDMMSAIKSFHLTNQLRRAPSGVQRPVAAEGPAVEHMNGGELGMRRALMQAMAQRRTAVQDDVDDDEWDAE